MERVYDQGDNIKDVTMFVGTEVEHTPQYGKKTLFVVGVQNVDDVMVSAEEQGCRQTTLC